METLFTDKNQFMIKPYDFLCSRLESDTQRKREEH